MTKSRARFSHPNPFMSAFTMLAICFVIATCLSAPLKAQTVFEPPRGSAERKEVLDAVRPLMEAHLHAPVEFVINWMRVGNSWAFVGVSPQRPGGGAIDPRGTFLADQAEYMDGLHTYALLRHQYGRWNIVDFAIGPTDAFWDGSALYSQVPQGLLPH
ncbi:hypothetical protein [Roseibium sediminis]|uniref:hypothetical protein n=1 Tax=Roseibium sediminis TaxID=1775174 RepID=UPI00123D8B38|nr:hypothetical protein [Roseibium sediminis]